MSKNTKSELSTTNNVDDIPTNSVINLDISEKASSSTATATITKPAIDLTKKKPIESRPPVVAAVGPVKTPTDQNVKTPTDQTNDKSHYKKLNDRYLIE